MADDELLLLLKAGNEDAFKVIFERYRMRLFLEADNKLDDEADANDIVQEIFFSLWQKRTSISVQTSLKHYLLQTARYKCIDIIRSRTIAEKRRQHYAYFKETTLINDAIETLELGKHLNTAINEISPASRTAFKMMYVEGKSLKEIASTMGISVFTVKNQIVNALKKLRKTLKKVK